MDLNEFESLKPEEQEKVFHHSSFKEKGELLLHSHDPIKLTRSLSQEELYLVTKEMDLEERSEVIKYASLPQLFFISDVDCWKKDRIHERGFTNWLETLLNADENRTLAWMIEMDAEMIIAGFKKIIRVLKPEHEYAIDEVLGDTPYFTLDNMYYIVVDEENLGTIKRAIEVLFENKRGRYVALLEEVMGELDDEIEEEAFQRREMRLAERGFPDFETARKIYRPISKQELEDFPVKKWEGAQPAEKARVRQNIPNYPVLWSKAQFFLDEILLLFREDTTGASEKLEEELAWLSNKVIACTGIDFSSEERVREGIERARAFVNLGLEELSGRDPAKAEEILKKRWLETVFRWGATQVFSLRDQAQKIVRDYWNGSQVQFLGFMNPPYEFITAGVLRTLPEFYDANLGESFDALRDFKTLSDLAQTRRALDQIEAVHAWIQKKDPGAFATLQKAKGLEESGITLFSFLSMLFVKFSSEAKDRDKIALMISEKELQNFLKTHFETKGSQRFLKSEKKENFMAKSFSETERNLLKPFWAVIFDNLEEELGSLDPSAPVDPKFVALISIKGQKKTPKRKGLKSKK
jgi:hypothetical protein